MAWYRNPPKNDWELVEDFVHEEDTLVTPTSHALLAIRMMKVRDLIKNLKVRRLLLTTAVGHL